MPKRRAGLVYAGFGASRLPKVTATNEQEEQLRSIVDRALIKAEKEALGPSLEDRLDRDPVTVVEQAVAHLIREKVFSASVPKFRAMVRKQKPGELRKTLEALAKLLTDTDAFPPWYQMRAVFTDGNPFAEDLSHDGDPAKEEEWRNKYAPGILLAAVRQHLALMDRLHELAKGTRPVAVPEHRFVEGLATYWRRTLGLQVTVSRADGNQTGDFVDFVDATRRLCPKSIKIGPLGGHIRNCSERNKK